MFLPDSYGVNPDNSLLLFEPLGLRSCDASIAFQDSSRSEMTGTCDNEYALMRFRALQLLGSA